MNFESTQAASLAHLSLAFNPLTNSSVAPAAVRNERSDKCWLKNAYIEAPAAVGVALGIMLG